MVGHQFALWGRIASCARFVTAQNADEIGAQVENLPHIPETDALSPKRDFVRGCPGIVTFPGLAGWINCR
jgi:hypothetical protein